jgi:hypothetical protein
LLKKQIKRNEASIEHKKEVITGSKERLESKSNHKKKSEWINQQNEAAEYS